MTPLEKEIIRRKLAVIIENLQALTPIKKMTQEQYVDDIYKRKATERLLQELIEAAIDINTHIITQTDNTVTDDYYESFVKMGECSIIPTDLANELAPSAGLRNRLVHEYDTIEHSIILEAVKKVDELYPLYIKAIDRYISQ
ncbi:MAG: DUF86 domain-containing protein [Candidatus Brocadiaceae bacterium]|nr:DUF86 domain-containing protein [Candidatus Brocadiaceae bacterium]